MGPEAVSLLDCIKNVDQTDYWFAIDPGATFTGRCKHTSWADVLRLGARGFRSRALQGRLVGRHSKGGVVGRRRPGPKKLLDDYNITIYNETPGVDVGAGTRIA